MSILTQDAGLRKSPPCGQRGISGRMRRRPAPLGYKKRGHSRECPLVRETGVSSPQSPLDSVSALRQKLRPLPCVSSPHKSKRFCGVLLVGSFSAIPHILKNGYPDWGIRFLGARGGSRTRTPLRALAPEASESTNSTTRASGFVFRRTKVMIPLYFTFVNTFLLLTKNFFRLIICKLSQAATEYMRMCWNW